MKVLGDMHFQRTIEQKRYLVLQMVILKIPQMNLFVVCFICVVPIISVSVFRREYRGSRDYKKDVKVANFLNILVTSIKGEVVLLESFAKILPTL